MCNSFPSQSNEIGAIILQLDNSGAEWLSGSFNFTQVNDRKSWTRECDTGASTHTVQYSHTTETRTSITLLRNFGHSYQKRPILTSQSANSQVCGSMFWAVIPVPVTLIKRYVLVKNKYIKEIIFKINVCIKPFFPNIPDAI